MTKVKICGLRRLCDIDFVNEAMPDYAGFVFAKGRKRCVTAEQAYEMKKKLSGSIKSVGVFVGEDIDFILSLCKEKIIDLVQLHGNQSNEEIEKIKLQSGALVIKAFFPALDGQLELAEKSSADFVLFDAGAGGSGQGFDHSLLRDFKRPFFLAGGLSEKNVAKAIEEVSPFAIDTSSGVEENGFKSRDKIFEFVKNARRY